MPKFLVAFDRADGGDPVTRTVETNEEGFAPDVARDELEADAGMGRGSLSLKEVQGLVCINITPL